MEREKGVATATCPNHPRTDVPVETQGDGSVASGPCPKCYPAPSKTEVASAAPDREQATVVAEEDKTDG